jgi:hypothetical protein
MVINELTLVDDFNPELSLNTFLNDENRILIECGYLDDDKEMYKGFLTIDKNDAIVLVRKLQEFIELME